METQEVNDSKSILFFMLIGIVVVCILIKLIIVVCGVGSPHE